MNDLRIVVFTFSFLQLRCKHLSEFAWHFLGSHYFRILNLHDFKAHFFKVSDSHGLHTQQVTAWVVIVVRSVYQDCNALAVVCSQSEPAKRIIFYALQMSEWGMDHTSHQ